MSPKPAEWVPRIGTMTLPAGPSGIYDPEIEMDQRRRRRLARSAQQSELDDEEDEREEKRLARRVRMARLERMETELMSGGPAKPAGGDSMTGMAGVLREILGDMRSRHDDDREEINGLRADMFKLQEKLLDRLMDPQAAAAPANATPVAPLDPLQNVRDVLQLVGSIRQEADRLSPVPPGVESMSPEQQIRIDTVRQEAGLRTWQMNLKTREMQDAHQERMEDIRGKRHRIDRLADIMDRGVGMAEEYITRAAAGQLEPAANGAAGAAAGDLAAQLLDYPCPHCSTDQEEVTHKEQPGRTFTACPVTRQFVWLVPPGHPSREQIEVEAAKELALRRQGPQPAPRRRSRVDPTWAGTHNGNHHAAQPAPEEFEGEDGDEGEEGEGEAQARAGAPAREDLENSLDAGLGITPVWRQALRPGGRTAVESDWEIL